MPPKKTIEEYIEEIKDIHDALKEYPDNKTLLRKRYNRLSSFADLVEITTFQSPEEKHPWLSEELGHNVRPMLTKKQIKIEQTADYQAYYQGPGFAGWFPFLVERKAEDLYSTLSNEESRSRFYDEISRFKADERFSEMYLIAECSYEDFLKYVPRFSGRDENGRPKRNKNHISVSVQTREATIAGLYIRGCSVIFAGSRSRAIKMYKDLLRQWILKNYDVMLGLNVEPYNDLKHLQEKKARLEAELKAVCGALGASA